MKNSNQILLCLLLIFLQACNESPKLVLDNKVLVDYFETDEVQISRTDRNIKIIVGNSKRVNQEKGKNDYKWLNAEPFGSIGALLFSSQLENKPFKADSIFVKIINQGREERYSYKVDDLRNIKKYRDSCIRFAKLVGEKEYAKAKEILGTDILGKQSAAQIDTFLSTLASPGDVLKSELIAFTISDKMAGLYINIYYNNSVAQTYIFTFRMNEGGKIAGISTPKLN